MVALTKSAPPEYSEVMKEQPLQQGIVPVQSIQQPGQPQCVHTQHSGVQPGVQATPYMVCHANIDCVLKVSAHQVLALTLFPILVPCTQVQTPFQPTTFPRPNSPGPHNFLMFIVITTAILAILNPLSLGFGIPSSILSILVSNNGVVSICSGTAIVVMKL